MMGCVEVVPSSSYATPSLGEALLVAQDPEAAGSVQLSVSESRSLLHGGAVAEELAWHKKSVVWSCGSAVRKRFTAKADVVQACFADFPDAGTRDVTVLLQPSLLTTVTAGGQLQDIPLPPHTAARMWPTPAGLLLEGPSACGVALLTHPLETPLPVLADVSLRSGRPGSYAGWSGERVVWAGRELPYAATYSDVGGRIALWRITRATLPPGAVGNLPDLPAATPGPHTPFISSVRASGSDGRGSAGGGAHHARGVSPLLPPAWSPGDMAVPARGSSGGRARGGHSGGGAGGDTDDDGTPMSLVSAHTPTAGHRHATPPGHGHAYGTHTHARGGAARQMASPAPSMAWPSSVKRPAARTPDGRLSPSMFNPAPRAGGLAGLGGSWYPQQQFNHAGAGGGSTPTPMGGVNGSGGGGGSGTGAMLLCDEDGDGGGGALAPAFDGSPVVVFELVHEEPLPTGSGVGGDGGLEAILVTDADGTPLLCLLSTEARRLTALRLPAAAGPAALPATGPSAGTPGAGASGARAALQQIQQQGGQPVVAFSVAAMAAAAVAATGTAHPAASAPTPAPLLPGNVARAEASTPDSGSGGGRAPQLLPPCPPHGRLLELLVLSPDGQLTLRQGRHVLCDVSVPLALGGGAAGGRDGDARTQQQAGGDGQEAAAGVGGGAGGGHSPMRQLGALNAGGGGWAAGGSDDGDGASSCVSMDSGSDSEMGDAGGGGGDGLSGGGDGDAAAAARQEQQQPGSGDEMDVSVSAGATPSTAAAAGGALPPGEALSSFPTPSAARRQVPGAAAAATSTPGGSGGGGGARVVGLSHGVGDRVTVHLACGARARVCLPLRPVGQLLAVALAACGAVLPEAVRAELLRRFYAHPGATSGSVAEEWGALTAVLLGHGQGGGVGSVGSVDSGVVGSVDGGGATPTPPGGVWGASGHTHAAPQQQQRQHTAQGDASPSLGHAAAASFSFVTPRQPLLKRRAPPSAAVGPTAAPSPGPAAASGAAGGAAAAVQPVWADWGTAVALPCLLALHALYEDAKLDTLSWPRLLPLGRTLAAAAGQLGLAEYWEHYARDLGPGALDAPRQHQQGQGPSASAALLSAAGPPADVFRLLRQLLGGARPSRRELPALLTLFGEGDRDVGCAAAAAAATPGQGDQGAGRATAAAAAAAAALTPRTRDLLACYEVLCSGALSCAAATLEHAPCGDGSSPAAAAALHASLLSSSESLVLVMARQGWTRAAIDTLPHGVQLPLLEAFQRLRNKPPGSGWPHQAYALIGREDIAAMMLAASHASTAAGAAAGVGPGADAAAHGAASGGVGTGGDGRGGDAAALFSPGSPPSPSGSGFGSHGGFGGFGFGRGHGGPPPTPMLGAQAAAALAAGLAHRQHHGGGPAADARGPGGPAGDARAGAHPPHPLGAGSLAPLHKGALPLLQAPPGGVGGSAWLEAAAPHLSGPAPPPGLPGDDARAPAAGPTPSAAALPHHRQQSPYHPTPSTATPASSIFCFGAARGGFGGAPHAHDSTPLSRGAHAHAAHGAHHVLRVVGAGTGAAAVVVPGESAGGTWSAPRGASGIDSIAGGTGGWVRWLLPHSYHLHSSTISGGRGAGGGTAALGPSSGGDGSGGGADAADWAADGMGGLLGGGAAALRFGHDGRLGETARLLASHRPLALRCGAAAAGARDADPDAPLKLQQQLWAGSQRTLALPVGRGALGLGTLAPLPTEPLPLPPLCLAGTLPTESGPPGGRGDGAAGTVPTPASAPQQLALDLGAASPAPGGGATADVTAWPEFHNGCAAGLRLAAHSSSGSGGGGGAPGGGGARGGGGAHAALQWGAFRRPDAPSYAHAGMLLAMGISGHLKRRPVTEMYRYLSEQHDATTVGVLLGAAACHRGTADPRVSKMLLLHVPSAHPDGFPELELSPLVQASALMGLGLLHQGSCQRLMVEILMREVERRVGGPPHCSADGDSGSGGGGEGGAASAGGSGSAGVSQDREGYALCAGLALGLLMLGRGRSCAGLADLKLEERLVRLMRGDGESCGSGAGGGGGGGRGGLPAHMAVTSPAACMALTLTFLRSDDATAGGHFAPPTSRLELANVRPDLLLLRTLGRSLVMWGSTEPSLAWVESQLPPLTRAPLPRLMDRMAAAASALASEQQGDGGGAKARAGAPRGGARCGAEDALSVTQAHIHATAGACLALGIKYAGTGDAAAHDTLRAVALRLLAAKKKAPDTAPVDAAGAALPGAAAAAASGGAGGAPGLSRLDKGPLEGCLAVVVLGLSLVMAGSGHPATLRLVTRLLGRHHPSSAHQVARLGINYGTHMALSMASGFLFLGGGALTFGRSDGDVAALLIALFPRLPTGPTDNRCHLQALRHLYALAAQPRCMTAWDVDSRALVHVPLRLAAPPMRAQHAQHAPDNAVRAASSDQTERVATTAAEARTAPAAAAAAGGAAALVTPCLVPERALVGGVSVLGPRYWPQTLTRAGASAGASAGSGGGDHHHNHRDGDHQQQQHGSGGDHHHHHRDGNHQQQHHGSGSGGMQWHGGGASGSLDGAYDRLALFVKKKAGALSYADDPSGIRSLLSRAFHHARAGSTSAAPVDMVHLCATFSAEPSITGLARHLGTMRELGRERWAAEAQATAGTDGPSERFHHDAAATLHECIVGEKAGVVAWHLPMRALVADLVADAAAGARAGAAGASDAVDASGAGAGGCVADAAAAASSGASGGTALSAGRMAGTSMRVRSLALCRAYYSSGLAAAAESAHAHASVGGDATSAVLWAPLMHPAGLDALWLQLRALWQRVHLEAANGGGCKDGAGHAAATAGVASSASAPGVGLATLVSLGRLPSEAELRGAVLAAAQRQQGGSGQQQQQGQQQLLLPLLCLQLVAGDVPSGCRLSAALASVHADPSLRQLCDALGALGSADGGDGVASGALPAGLAAAVLAPLLGEHLPGTPPGTLLQLAACAALAPGAAA
ncbi:hypothetical protein FOA52_001904 [Chlamydomonas sp. UWO 241]|nr:hypothetical protein FOA52_001904 [Chlamydomonas sp. UWO 241]